jgi:hypothetical protein
MRGAKHVQLPEAMTHELPEGNTGKRRPFCSLGGFTLLTDANFEVRVPTVIERRPSATWRTALCRGKISHAESDWKLSCLTPKSSPQDLPEIGQSRSDIRCISNISLFPEHLLRDL